MSKPDEDGVGFADILRYVMAQLRMSETRAAFHVSSVLNTGLALNRIEKTPAGKYRLKAQLPPALACKIDDLRGSDDGSSADSD